MVTKKQVFFFAAVTLFFSCERSQPLFETLNVSGAGIDFRNELKETDDFNILDYLYFYNGGGTAIGDVNSDGLPDIFFAGNQVKNRLYINKGNLMFEDITDLAGVAGNSSWNTGAVMGDINGDGLLDIYVCAVVGLKGLGGHNELYINNGDNTFSEQSVQYGLDFDTYSSSAAFLDYDLDGDLDIYLLNHAIHTPESFGNANLRNKRTYETGDRLLKNEGAKFIDVSEGAGIYGGVNGYGLGISVADFNVDGYPDIYVGNDFHEDDYFYLNNADGTFSEKLKKYFGHTSRFTMGIDAADINHDGRPDLMSLDMLPEEEYVLKNSEGDDDFNIQRLKVERYGYHYQYSRNTLQLNTDKGFMEVALQSGVAATDWSWSALFADFDQDSNQDLFISNGIPKRPNDLDYIKFVSSDQIREKISSTKLVDNEALDLMPSGVARNCLFKGSGSIAFENITSRLPTEKTYSTATAMGDLDNDGDIDLVINNVNGAPSIYVNQTNTSANYIKLKLNYSPQNSFGIGTNVFAYHNGTVQSKELYTVRGFQASSEPLVHFGLGNDEQVDSLRITWPDGTSQLEVGVKVNQTLTISPVNNARITAVGQESVPKLFLKVKDKLGIDFRHLEDRYTDFNRQALIPYQLSDRGPATAIGDLNDDGLDDLYFGGSKFVSSAIYLQTSTGFEQHNIPTLQKDSVKEETNVSIKDFTGDGVNDVLIGSGGADFYNEMVPLLDGYLVWTDTGYFEQSLPKMFENASVIAPFDFDSDGDLDVFIGNQTVSNDFGGTPRSFLLENTNGAFSIVQNEELQTVGMVTDAMWSDYNNDGTHDLIVVGEWMSPTFFRSENGLLKKDKVIAKELRGLWQTIEAFDIDSDGDEDYLIGNWGINTKFRASSENPLRMYFGDVDGNGSSETILAQEKDGDYFPLETLDHLATQLVSLRKKYTSYKDFAGKTVEEVFQRDLGKLKLLLVQELNSGFLKNENGSFVFTPFPEEMQIAPIMSFVVNDFDGDGENEALAGGNYFGATPYHGRFDSFPGALILSENEVLMGNQLGLDWLNKSVRDLNVLEHRNSSYLLVTLNNDSAQVYQLIK